MDSPSEAIICARIILKTMIILTLEGSISSSHWNFRLFMNIETIFCVLVFKCIRGLAPHHLSNVATMVVDGYNTRNDKNMGLYVPRCTKELCKRSFVYKGSMLCNALPNILLDSSSLVVFKSNYRFIIGWRISKCTWVFFDDRTLLSGFGTNVGFVLCFRIIHQIFYDMNYYLCRYGICLLVYCDNKLCFRQGSKMENNFTDWWYPV